MLKCMTDLNRIAQEIRNYEGVKRKNPIKYLINQFKPFSNYGNTVIDFGDDAAVLKFDNNYLLLACLLYTSPSPRDRTRSRMPSSA